MLQKIRDRSTGVFSWLIIGVIIIVFALFGVSYYFNNGVHAEDRSVATVNGEKISQRQLRVASTDLRAQLQQNKNTHLSSAIEKYLQHQALQSLIQVTALKQSAQALGFVVSPQTLQSLIQHIPAFQEKGTFSPRLLQYAENLHPDLMQNLEVQALLAELQSGIVNTEFYLKNEEAQAIALLYQQRDISYIEIPVDHFAKDPVTVTSQAEQDYYHAHAADYEVPSQVKLNYVVLSLADIKKTIQPNDAALKKFFAAHADRYKKPFPAVESTVRADYIRVHAKREFDRQSDRLANISYTEPSSLDPVTKELKLKIETTDFISAHGTASGITANPEVLRIAFSHDVRVNSNNSDVINIAPGEQLVLRVVASKPKSEKSFAEVELLIKQRLIAEARRLKASDLAVQIKKQLDAGTSLESIAKQYEWPVKSAGWVNRMSKTVPAAILKNAFIGKVTVTPIDETAYAVAFVHAIKPGVPTEATTALSAQLTEALGSLEYDLYARHVVSQARIK